MRSVAVVLAWAILAAVAVPSQAADYVVPVLELSDQDLTVLDLDDVSTADWEAVLGEPTLTAADFRTAECCGYPSYDPTDLDFRAWLGWHEGTNRIYCAVERADDVNLMDDLGRGLTPRTWDHGGFWRQDSIVQFAIDGDGRGGSSGWAWEGGVPESEQERRDAVHREVQEYWVLGDLEGPWRKVYLIENGYEFGITWFVTPPSHTPVVGTSGSDQRST